MSRIFLVMHWVIFSLVTHVHSEITVFFFRNGGNMEGVPLLLSDDDFKSGWDSLFNRFKTEVPSIILPQSRNEDWTDYKLYNINGSSLQRSTQNLAKYDQENIYVVPINRYFIWPYVQLGHRGYANGIVNNGPIVLTSLSAKPGIFHIENLFTNDEAEYLIKNALSLKGGDALIRSTTGTKPREDRDLTVEVDSERTSTNAWDQVSPVAVDIMKRIFELLDIPYFPMQGGGLQIVRYAEKQAYRSHYDWFPIGTPPKHHNFDATTGGTNRYATVFLYLNDVEEGGQTVFPNANVVSDNDLDQLSSNVSDVLNSRKKSDLIMPVLSKLFKPYSWQKRMAEECYSSFSVKPNKGTAVLFYSMTPNWKTDTKSLHGGCPVLNGIKWGANAWIWNGPRFSTHEVTNIRVRFTNGFNQMGKLFWNKHELITIGAGKFSHHNTYHGHRFRFEIDGKAVWYHTIDKKDGAEQSIDMYKKHREL